jgi:ribonuclease-3
MAVNSTSRTPTPAPRGPLEARLGHRFSRHTLLELALTHRSVAHERAQLEPVPAAATPLSDNEQLEFLGDAVVGLLVADELYRRYPALDEGGLTRMRAFLVSRRHLATVAAALSVGEHLLLGRGEQQTGGRNKTALLANAMEAIIAAVYLDAGLEAARTIVVTHIIQPALSQLISEDSTHLTVGDHKSALQQRMQAAGLGTPRYVVTAESGPDHLKHFTVEVRLDAPGHRDVVLGQAAAGNKKEAQQAAARIACLQLEEYLSSTEGRTGA